MKQCKQTIVMIIMCVMFALWGRMDIHAQTITGTNGQNITWKIENGVLTISGKGPMLDCGHHEKVTWFEGDMACEYENDEEWWGRNILYTDEIKHVVIEEGITSIAPHAFRCMDKTETIVIPSTVTYIGHAAFEASGFRQIVIPDSVTYIGIGAFDDCYDLKNVKLSQNIKDIKTITFKGCQSLRQITLPEQVKTIGEDAFLYCEALQQVSLPKELNKIDVNAFAKCRSLKQITLPSKLQTIGGGAFAECTKLEKVTWEGKSTLKTIKSNAFVKCNIKKLTIPASVTDMDDGSAVNGGVHKICVEKGNKKYKAKDGVLFSKNGKTLVSYPCKKKGSTYKIPKGVKTIGAYAFSAGDYYKSNKYLRKIIMPDTVKAVKEGAFLHVEKLNTVRLSKNLKRVEQQAFSYCALTSLKLPDSLVYIGDRAFDAEKIKGTIVIPKNVKEIEDVAFPDALKVKKVIVKSKKLKKVGKQIIGIASAYENSVKKIKVILPKSKQKAYQKFFTKKKQGKYVKFIYK